METNHYYSTYHRNIYKCKNHLKIDDGGTDITDLLHEKKFQISNHFCGLHRTQSRSAKSRSVYFIFFYSTIFNNSKKIKTIAKDHLKQTSKCFTSLWFIQQKHKLINRKQPYDRRKRSALQIKQQSKHKGILLCSLEKNTCRPPLTHSNSNTIPKKTEKGRNGNFFFLKYSKHKE